MIATSKTEREIDIWLFSAVALIHALIFSNAWRHDPRIGYDSEGHLAYIETLARGHLPSIEESREFFSPPLPYVFPGLLRAGGVKILSAAKAAQFLQAILSLGLFYFLIKICRLVSPRRMVSLGAVVFTGMLPVYYRSFAFVRGEPYVAFFALMSIYYFLLTMREFRWRNAMAAGAALGGCILSRQWGVFLVPAFAIFAAAIWWRNKSERLRIAESLGAIFAIGFLIGGWFYVDLRGRNDSVTAFNREPSKRFSFANQPREFYLEVEPRLLFTRPTRPNFPNELIPIFYSETWGDYWWLFCVWGKDLRKDPNDYLSGIWLAQSSLWEKVPPDIATNYETMSRYLGRVNLMSILPTSLAFCALALALRRMQNRVFALGLLVIAFSLAGYFWFLIQYPNLGKGDTIKATYMLHLFPLAGVFVGYLLGEIEGRRVWLARGILVALVAIALHNLGAMVTHYS